MALLDRSRPKKPAARSKHRAVVSGDPLTIPDEALGGIPKCCAGMPHEAVLIGRVNTPAHIARWMAREAVKVLTINRRARRNGSRSPDLGAPPPAGVGDGLARESPPTIVEPAAGSGVVVAALVEAMQGRQSALGSIHAIDSDPAIKAAAGRRLQLALGKTPARWLRRQYRIGDALLDPSLLPDKPIDLIIGNPPYLGVRHARRLPNYDAWRERFGVTEDLYAFFVRWALQTVRPGGHVLLLVPDGWLTQSSYEDLRGELLRGRLRTIVRLGVDTFDRHVFPCFFLWQKAHARSNVVRYVDARSLQHSVHKVKQSIYAAAPGRIIFLPTPNAQRLSKVYSPNSNGPVKPLVEIARIADVGIHSRNCRHRLFYASRTKRGLHRLLQGRQIEPYAVRWNSPKAQYCWVDIHYEPKPGRLGRRGNGQPSVRPEYWDWQGDPAIHRLPERILIRQTGDRIVAARCLQSRNYHYTDNTLFTATLTDTAQSCGITYAYLLAYLNSAIVSDLYRFLSGEQGRAQAQIKINLLRRLPFVLSRPASIRRVETIVERIETLALSGSMSAKDQVKIDRHFARLFTSESNGMLAAGNRVTRRVAISS